ncbi:PUB1 [Candida margitis]|uniref:PUB1 n=1 Tax=Candida margitis TaxID=1775924 RepID=UPI002227900A|nr:PUB1 [Candida margitis]KAI5969793.1 PUB1 [Candida margitis]
MSENNEQTEAAQQVKNTEQQPSTTVPEPTPANEQENKVADDDQPQPEAGDESSQEPPVTPASAIEGGRETSNRILYVGNLPKSASEEQVSELFSVSKPVKSIKLLNDKNKLGFNYAFIEFDDNQDADMALSTLNGKLLNNCEIKVNWAYQSATIASTSTPEDPTYNIFVGDLSSEVNDDALKKAFNKFDSFKEAHVMWDMQTSRSRGYGFVTFGKQEDAELTLQTMNGEWLGGRAIRCNWASHKQANNRSGGNGDYHNSYGHNGFRNHNNTNNSRYNNRQFRPYSHNGKNFNNSIYPHHLNSNSFSPPNGSPAHVAPGLNGLILPDLNASNGNLPQLGSQQPAMINSPPNGLNGNAQQAGNITVMSPQSYDIVLRQTPSWQTTVYLGNIAHVTQQQEIIPLLQNFGFIVDFKFHPEKGCAFVKYDSHERAALAIIQLAGFNLNGRPLKCGWGKERPPQYQNRNVSQGSSYGGRS